MPASNSHLPLPNWKVPAGRALEAALNRALALDPETRDALARLDGRRVALRVAQPPLALQVTVEGDRLRVGPVDGERAADLDVRGTLAGLVSQLPMFRRGDDGPPVGTMRIEGDADLARRLQRLAERFDPDWHAPFVAVFGDVLGVQVAKVMAGALRQARAGARDLAETTVEYLTEESRDLVPREELAAFNDDVDALRDDVERIAARIARLPAGGAA
ncbi:MAG TPA: SCP2 sterol-binding domain-containing protein [Xanthomonadaceae bacterium]|nr:SCP2 sterol-binding domain-containing protein [Xanthomonadaceae bacterium]